MQSFQEELRIFNFICLIKKIMKKIFLKKIELQIIK